MTILSKEAILQANDIKKVLVEVPEWGGQVYVRSMTAIQRDKFELAVQEKKIQNWRALIASQTICDENGNTLFNEQDINALSQKSASALSRVFDKAIELSRFTNEDIEELEKN